MFLSVVSFDNNLVVVVFKIDVIITLYVVVVLMVDTTLSILRLLGTKNAFRETVLYV